MTDDIFLLHQLEKLLNHKKSKQFYANRLGVTVEKINELFKQLKRIKNTIPDDGKNESSTHLEHSKRIDNDKGTIESILELDFEPKNDSELAKLHKIDLSKFRITNYWSKLKANGKFTSSVFCKRKGETDYTQEDFVEFLKNYKSNYIPSPPPERTNKQLIDLELSIYDFHLAKRYNEGDNDPGDRAFLFFDTALDLVQKTTAIFDIDTLVFPISNDFFHTDGYNEETTKGTPQDIIMRYDHEYELGFAMLVDTITMLKTKCKKLVVVLVQGNHDRAKAFYLAHALSIFFKRDVNIVFDREHNNLKGITVGNTFIGYHHGNCKITDIPLLFAASSKFGADFGKSKFKEIHTGDKHHYMALDHRGIRIQQMPSLSGDDRWHTDHNFFHQRAALALVYDKEKGKTMELEYRI